MKKYKQKIHLKLLRFIWSIVWLFFCRFTPPIIIFNQWRILILKFFGAKIDWSSKIYPSVKVFQPWKLTVSANSCLGPYVDCYNYDQIFIGKNAIISQNSYLCTASHDYTSKKFDLVTGKINILDNAWVASRCFIGPNVTVNRGSIILACAVITKDTLKDSVYGGNPAKFIKKR